MTIPLDLGPQVVCLVIHTLLPWCNANPSHGCAAHLPKGNLADLSQGQPARRSLLPQGLRENGQSEGHHQVQVVFVQTWTKLSALLLVLWSPSPRGGVFVGGGKMRRSSVWVSDQNLLVPLGLAWLLLTSIYSSIN